MSAADEVDALATRIEQIDELGAGDLCLWKKDGTLLTDGTLASNGVGRGHNLYAVLRATASSTAVPAYTCPEFWSGTVPVNHGADFPGQITCGCARTPMRRHLRACKPSLPTKRPPRGSMHRRNGSRRCCRRYPRWAGWRSH